MKAIARIFHGLFYGAMFWYIFMILPLAFCSVVERQWRDDLGWSMVVAAVLIGVTAKVLSPGKPGRSDTSVLIRSILGIVLYFVFLFGPLLVWAKHFH